MNPTPKLPLFCSPAPALALALLLALAACSDDGMDGDVPNADADTTSNQVDAASGQADAASGEPDAQTPAGSCSDEAEIEELFASRCAGGPCHSGTGGGAGLDLVSPGLAERLVGEPSSQQACGDQILVVAGDPDASLLVDKLEPSPSCGSRMPRNQTPLTEEEITCVRDWIAGMSAGR